MKTYYYFLNRLCPLVYSTCNKESDVRCPVSPDKANSWEEYNGRAKLAHRCIFLGVELTQEEYQTRYIPESKSKMFDIDRVKTKVGKK